MIGNVTRNANFNSIAQYIFGKPGAEMLLENVSEGRTVAEKAASMQWVAARNERVKRPAYHLSLSPAKDDDLSRGEWSMLCSQVLDELGWGRNQVLVGLHHDVKYPNSEKTRTHAHLLINLVDDFGKCANTSWDYLKIPKVLRHLERSYGLQAVPDVIDSQKQRDTSGQYRVQERSLVRQETPTSAPRSVRRRLQDIIDEAMKHSSSFTELSAAMESLGIQVNNTEQGWWMQYSGIAFAGYQLGRDYTKPAILKRLEVEQMADFEEPSNNSNEATDDTPVSSMRDVFLSDTADTDFLRTESEPEVTTDTSEPTEQLKAKHQKTSKPKPKLKQKVPTGISREDASTTQAASSESETCQEPEVSTDITREESSTARATNSDSETSQESELTKSQNIGELVVAPGNLISMMKQQANYLEQSDYIDGRFYAGMFLDTVAHLAEIVEVGREVWSEGQETETQKEVGKPQNEIPLIKGDSDWLDSDWLDDKEALRIFDERLSNSTEPPSSDVPIDVQENSIAIAVAESLSQFVHVRAAVYDLNLDEPIETNLGTLQFSPDEDTISITQNVTVARWDESLQEWQLKSELADSHKNNVTRLLNNQAVDVDGYQFSGDKEESTIIFGQVRFRAELTNDGWQDIDNSLSSSEQRRILQLPQSESEYAKSINSKDIIDYFQRHAREQFRFDAGSIHWTANNGSFDRIFEVSKQSDQSHLVEGFDLTQADDWGNPRKIFSASIESDASIQCSQCDIPAEDIDRLLSQELSQEPEVAERKKERER